MAEGAEPPGRPDPADGQRAIGSGSESRDTPPPGGAADQSGRARRPAADRDRPDPPAQGSTADTDAQQDDPTTYDPEGDQSLDRERAQGKSVFSGTASRSRMLGDNSGQATQGENAHAVGAVFGDVIGTSTTTVHIGSGRRQYLMRTVNRTRLKDESVFVETVGGASNPVDDLVRGFAVQRMAVLWGPAGAGRDTAAARALHRVLPPEAGIDMFTLGRTPTQLREMSLCADHGYVVDVRPALERRSLLDVLGDVGGHAEQRQALIVAIVDETCATTVRSVTYPVVHQPEPDRRHVLRTLLLQVHHRTSTEADTVGPNVLGAIEKASMEQIALTTAAVARALDDGEEPHAYLREEVCRRVAGKFDQPFSPRDVDVDDRRDRRERDEDQVRAERLGTYRRCVMLAAAVLDGFTLREITDAADDLYKVLHEDDPDAGALDLPFALPTPELLEWLGAGRVPAPEATAADRIEFGDRQTPDVVVEYVWTSHHLAVDVVTKWLDGMAVVHHHARRRIGNEVRLRAAQVVGRLASYDFAHVVRDVIEERWIASGTVSGLRATSRAVEVMADDPRIAVATWEKVREWSRGAPRRRRAASIVYAESLQPAQTGDALALVRRTAHLPQDLDYALAAVLRSAARAGSVDQVFALLVEWLRTIEEARTQFGKLRFAGKIRVVSGLPAHLTRTVILLCADDDRHVRPRLLEALRTDGGFADTLVDAWRLALSDPAVTRRATDALRSWLVAADADDEMAEVVQVMLTRLCGSAPLRRRLRYHAHRWITAWDGAYPISEGLLHNAIDAPQPPEEGVAS